MFLRVYVLYMCVHWQAYVCVCVCVGRGGGGAKEERACDIAEFFLENTSNYLTKPGWKPSGYVWEFFNFYCVWSKEEIY